MRMRTRRSSAALREWNTDVSNGVASNHEQRRTLLAVLMLNTLLSLALGIAGVVADSSALLANALDNASDAAVYLLSFIAV